MRWPRWRTDGAFGEVDILVNNAGVGALPAALDEISPRPISTASSRST